MAPITLERLRKVKAHLLSHPIPSRLAALIQLNTGMRISEPVLARLDDLVLDHDIPHLWVPKNSLTDRKTKPSSAVCRCWTCRWRRSKDCTSRSQAKKRLADAAIRI
jgi:integrase